MKYCPESNTFLSQNGSVVTGQIPHLMWHVTDVCPLNCPYCFAPKTNVGLQPQYIKPIVEIFAALGVQKVDLSGGEPLAYPFLDEVCHALWDAGIYATLTTSGVGSKKNKEFLLKNVSGFSRIIFSLDAPGRQHDMMRRKDDAWQSALSLIQAISGDERQVRCRINTVVTRPYIENQWGRELGPIVNSLKVKEWCLIQPHPANKKTTYDDYSLEKHVFMREVEEAREATARVEIITRDNSLYSTYWNVQPNGNLQQHTDGDADQKIISLVDNDITCIKRVLEHTATLVPT